MLLSIPASPVSSVRVLSVPARSSSLDVGLQEFGGGGAVRIAFIRPAALCLPSPEMKKPVITYQQSLRTAVGHRRCKRRLRPLKLSRVVPNEMIVAFPGACFPDLRAIVAADLAPRTTQLEPTILTGK